MQRVRWSCVWRARLHAVYGVDKGYNAATLANANNPYGGARPTPSADGRDYLLGFSAPVSNGTLMFSVMHKDDRTNFNQDAGSWGIGLYAAYAHIRNRNGAGYTVNNNTESGSGNTGDNLGIRHTF